MNRITNAAFTSIESAIAALTDSGLTEFASILRDERVSGSTRVAMVASEINARIFRIQENEEYAIVSNALSAVIREVYL